MEVDFPILQADKLRFDREGLGTICPLPCLGGIRFCSLIRRESKLYRVRQRGRTGRTRLVGALAVALFVLLKSLSILSYQGTVV
jgi:hypothetical protein